ncbi:MAG: hypothetical protein M1370_01025, partial [Bacteroidetes bacterium]|nr:hypothetical protein [Bacteroidota bacterium]
MSKSADPAARGVYLTPRPLASRQTRHPHQQSKKATPRHGESAAGILAGGESSAEGGLAYGEPWRPL